jgi:hypothetical protein
MEELKITVTSELTASRHEALEQPSRQIELQSFHISPNKRKRQEEFTKISASEPASS